MDEGVEGQKKALAAFERQRRMLVAAMQNSGAVESTNVANAFLKVKRERFFPGNQQHSYIDSAFPIGFGQTISQPSTIAIMLELLKVEKGMKVLEVGSGCGYVLALLSEFAGETGTVFGIDIVPELASASIENLKKAGTGNVSVRYGDGTKGMPEKAPFDRVLISAAAEEVPAALVGQLANGGRLVAPIGPRHTQQMLLITKGGGGSVEESYPENGYFVFVPLKK